MVFEVDLQGNEVHLGSIGPPVEPIEPVAATAESTEPTEVELENDAEYETEPWPERFTTQLASIIPEDAIRQIKELFLQGPEPPETAASEPTSSTAAVTQSMDTESAGAFSGDRRGGRGSQAGRGRGRGRGRGGRGGGRVDNRQVLLDVRYDPPFGWGSSADDTAIYYSQFFQRNLALRSTQLFANCLVVLWNPPLVQKPPRLVLKLQSNGYLKGVVVAVEVEGKEVCYRYYLYCYLILKQCRSWWTSPKHLYSLHHAKD
jgi:hypothetical protein